VFQKGSLDAIAELALHRGTGARALKSIIEEALLNSMFEIPSRPEIKRCLISERSIREALEPEFELGEEGEGPARLVGESPSSRRHDFVVNTMLRRVTFGFRSRGWRCWQ